MKRTSGTRQTTRRNAGPERQRTNVPGQNPKQDDAPHRDEHHDESRVKPQNGGVFKPRHD